MEETHMINDVKERLCYVSLDFESELAISRFKVGIHLARITPPARPARPSRLSPLALRRRTSRTSLRTQMRGVDCLDSAHFPNAVSGCLCPTWRVAGQEEHAAPRFRHA